MFQYIYVLIILIMNKSETKIYYLYILISFIFITVTTVYLSLFDIIYVANQMDVWSYREIANSAPTLPKESGKIIQNVAQRFLIHYLVGSFSSALKIDLFLTYKVFTFSFIILYIFIINFFRKYFQLNLKESILFFSLLFLNPYIVRYHIFNAASPHDMLFFCLGLIFAYTIISKNYFTNILITAFSLYLRQTSIALFVGSSIFFIIKRKIKLFFILLILYFLSLFIIIKVGKFISTDDFPINLAYQLIFFDFTQIDKLIRFLLLPLVSFFPLFIVFFGKIKKRIDNHNAFIILFVCIMMVGQPILGGPEGSVNNVGRIANLCYPILTIFCFYVFSFKKILKNKYLYICIIMGLFAWSLHPTFSIFDIFGFLRFYHY